MREILFKAKRVKNGEWIELQMSHITITFKIVVINPNLT